MNFTKVNFIYIWMSETIVQPKIKTCAPMDLPKLAMWRISHSATARSCFTYAVVAGLTAMERASCLTPAPFVQMVHACPLD